ncbi:MAG: PH domain-containing protein [Xanthobacteraceae bacterium]
MSYVKHVLQPGEEVRHAASLHWSLYLPGLLVCVLALIVALLRPDPSVHWVTNRTFVIAAWLLFAAGLILLAQAWFRWWTTEIAVTNRRVIYKTGFIWRDTTEMHMDKVESVDVKQSILGRILDYGDVEIRGVGTGFEPLRRIDAPLELRNHITAV